MSQVDPRNQSNYHSITKMFYAKNVKQIAAFYRDVFVFTIKEEMIDEGGKAFAEMEYRGSKFMILEEELEKQITAPSTLNGCTSSSYVYVDDVDNYSADLQKKDVIIAIPCTDMPWGDRCFVAIDPEGHAWMFATHKVDAA